MIRVHKCDDCGRQFRPKDGENHERCAECTWASDIANPDELAHDTCAIVEDFINEMERQGFSSGPLPAEYDTVTDYIKRWRSVKDHLAAQTKTRKQSDGR